MGKCELALSAVLLLLYVLDVSLSIVEFVPFANVPHINTNATTPTQ